MAEPLGRNRSLLGLTETVARHGVDPAVILSKAGIGADQREDPEKWIPFRAILASYELAAKLTNTPDFGLELAQSRDFSFLGPLTLILRYAPNFETALSEFQRYVSVQQSRAYQTTLQNADGAYICEYFVGAPYRTIANQWIEESLLSTLKTARIFLGESYKPLAVYMKHSPISPKRTYASYFGVTPSFDDEIDGIEFGADALRARNRAEDHDVLALVTSVLSEQTGWTREHVVSNVRNLIRRFLPTGKYSIEVIADQLCMNKRTLQRRLSQEDVNYGDLLEDTRKELAAELLADGNLPLSAIAYHLGYKEQSTFNHAFKRWYGSTPGEWRAKSRRARPGKGKT